MPDREVAELERALSALTARVAALEAVIRASGSSVTITSPGQLVLVAGGNLDVTAGSNVTLTSGGNLALAVAAAASLTIGRAFSLTTGGSCDARFGGYFAVSVATSTTLTSGIAFTMSTKDVSIAATGSAVVTAGRDVVATAASDFDIQAKSINASASMDATIKAANKLELRGARVLQS
jgi:uncharacterized protein (DUF2345 family)